MTKCLLARLSYVVGILTLSLSGAPLHAGPSDELISGDALQRMLSGVDVISQSDTLVPERFTAGGGYERLADNARVIGRWFIKGDQFCVGTMRRTSGCRRLYRTVTGVLYTIDDDSLKSMVSIMPS